MELNVADLLKDGYGALREYDLDDEVCFDGEAHRVTGHVRLDRTPAGVLVRCDAEGEARLSCSRCLESIIMPVHVSFTEQYVPTIDVLTGARVVEAKAEDDAYRISARHMIDLREPIEQYWAMALPMAPLCRPDCPGLCAVCGERAEDHTCAPEPADDRWSRLRDLRLT